MKRPIVMVVFVVTAICISVVPGRSASGDPIVTEGVVNAPANELWDMFTTRAGIESWMVAKTDIDLRPGGTWRTSYSKESDLNDGASIHHLILAYDPGRMFSFRTVKPPSNFPFPSAILKTWTVIYFEPEGESRTKVVTKMFGFTEDEESQRMRVFFEAGNKATLENLLKKFR